LSGVISLRTVVPINWVSGGTGSVEPTSGVPSPDPRWTTGARRDKNRAAGRHGSVAATGGEFATPYLYPPFPLRLLLPTTLLACERRRMVAASACTAERHKSLSEVAARDEGDDRSFLRLLTFLVVFITKPTA